MENFVKFHLKSAIIIGFLMILSSQAFAVRDQAPFASKNAQQTFIELFTEKRSRPISQTQETPSSSDLSATVAVGNDRFDMTYKVSEQIDRSAIIELNSMADRAWQALMKCNNNNVEKVRVQYLSSSFCPQAAEEVKVFRESLNLFLSSAPVRHLDVSASLHCSVPLVCFLHVPNRISYSEYHPYLSSSLTVHSSVDISFFKTALNQLPNQNFHPLLFQALLEYLAAGFPMKYHNKLCDSQDCGQWIRYPFEIRYSSNHRDLLAKYSKSMNPETTPLKKEVFLEMDGSTFIFPESELFDHGFARIWRAMVASRILNHISIGNMKCGDWGLWPEASLELLGVIGQSLGSGMISPSKTSVDFNLVSIRLSDACQIPIKKWTSDGSSSFYFISPAKAASTIGAWRTLYNRHQN